MSDIKNQFNHSKFENPIFHYDGNEIRKYLGVIPTKPVFFIGRDNSPDEIHERLNTNQNLLLLVNGEGGIGKTTLAAAYYHKFDHFYTHLIWLVADSNIQKVFGELAIHLNVTFHDNVTYNEQLQIIISTVKGLKRPVLLVIDNADSYDDLEKNLDLLQQLPNTHVIITSRVNDIEDVAYYPVESLTEEHAIELFKHHFKTFKAEEHELLKEVLPAVGYNTLVIELLAKNLNNFNNELEQTYPLKKLLGEIQQKGPLALSKTDEVKTNWKFKKAKPEDVILAMYEIAALNNTQQLILSHFAVLPNEAIPYKYLKQFLPNIESLDKELVKLSKEGWCTFDKQTASFKTNPIIATVCRQKNKDRIQSDILIMIESLVDRLDYQPNVGHIEGDFEEIKQYVVYSENVLQYPEFLDSDFYLLFERIGNFYRTHGNLTKALSYFIQQTELFEELYANNRNNNNVKNGLAISYSKLGSTHTSLGNLDKALKYFEQDLQLTKELYESNPDDVNVKSDLAISYSKLGSTHTSLGNLDKAQSYFEQKTDLFKELCESNPNHFGYKNGLAIAYERLGDTHTASGNLDEALGYFEKQIELFKGLNEINPDDVSFKNGLAVSYSKLGATHTSLKNLETALSYFEKQTELFEELYKINPNIVGFKNGLAISYSTLGSTHTSLGNLDKAINYLEQDLRLTKELNESNPDNVSFKHSLAISYFKIGSFLIEKKNDQNKGVELLNQAKSLFEHLKESYPMFQKIRTDYNLVSEKLKGVSQKKDGKN